jgi:DNA binding domain, excisionase family
MTELLSIKELATKMKLHERTLYRWTKARKIPYIKMPGNDIRFDKEKIENWLDLKTVPQKKTLAQIREN